MTGLKFLVNINRSFKFEKEKVDLNMKKLTFYDIKEHIVYARIENKKTICKANDPYIPMISKPYKTSI